MKINKNKLHLAMAKSCMNTEDLHIISKMPKPTIYNALSGKNVRPVTIGKIAKALGVDVTDILAD